MSLSFVLRDDWFAGANPGFDLFEPSPFPKGDHDDGSVAVSLDHYWPFGFGNVLVEETQRITYMRNRNGKVFEVVFVHEFAHRSDMYNNQTLPISAAVPVGVTGDSIFAGVPKTFLGA